MENLHVDCPHCGASFNVELHGEKANMMVFCCAHCKTPLMYCHGEVGELDKEEFAGFRKKLSRVIEAAVKRDSSLAGVADALREMVNTADELAEAQAAAETAAKHVIDDEALAALQKGLDEMDAESFLDQL